MPRPRWNHNLHYYDLLLDSAPPGCRRALDVGCGDGALARRLRAVIPRVCAIDGDARIVELARRQTPRADIEYRVGDFMTAEFEPESFDLVTCAATLHHMDAHAALARMRAILAPGGTLAILGLARNRYPVELPRAALATLVSRSYRVVRQRWDPPVRFVWPPPHTYPELERLALEALPGARYRRHLLWRYTLVWRKPALDGQRHDGAAG